ncbi:MAG: hypothetical protein JXL20_02750, partial [Deltaproteobacteria bacterium]|nr:hypothetical protein [Deltaproteobacteria bacterium]
MTGFFGEAVACPIRCRRGNLSRNIRWVVFLMIMTAGEFAGAALGAAGAGGAFTSTETVPQPTNCPSFCLDNNGYAVFGTNQDGDWGESYWYFNPRGLYQTVPDPDATADYTEWTARYASLTFTRTADPFLWTGMSEAGLVLSTMGLGGPQVPPPDEWPLLLKYTRRRQRSSAPTTGVICLPSTTEEAGVNERILVLILLMMAA